MELIGDALERD